MSASRGIEAPPTLEEICAPMTPEQRYAKFLGMLHDRKMSVDRLAQVATKAKNSRTHVLQVLTGKRKGTHTWARLVDFLTRDELIVLGKKELIELQILDRRLQSEDGEAHRA